MHAADGVVQRRAAAPMFEARNQHGARYRQPSLTTALS
jgi:hypothetical protein